MPGLRAEMGGDQMTEPFVQAGQIPGQFFIAVDKIPTVQSYFADSVVAGALPPGKQLLPGTDSVALGGKFRHRFTRHRCGTAPPAGHPC